MLAKAAGIDEAAARLVCALDQARAHESDDGGCTYDCDDNDESGHDMLFYT
jgi:hypothetical protein